MKEEWMEIEESPSFSVSNLGRIKQGILLHCIYTLTKNGKAIYLPINGKAELYLVDDLVNKYFGDSINIKAKSSSFTKKRKTRKCCGKK